VLNQVHLEQTQASLEAAHAQLKALDSFKSQLFANITHEFKTPLAMILAPLELILQGEMATCRRRTGPPSSRCSAAVSSS